VNRPLRGAFAAEMLAYVDNCLPQRDRRALENRMIEYPELKRQIEQWLLQNEAIRAAFADQPPRLALSAGGRLPVAGFAEGRAPRGVKTKRESEESQRRPRAIEPTGDRLRGVAAGAPATARRASKAKWRGPGVARRVFCTIAGALALWAASATSFSRDQSIAFVNAGVAAYRTFAGAAMRPVEIATADRGALDRWFATQVGRAAPVPDLAAAGLVLLGGRIVPGAFSPAQFLLYQNARRERVGVEIEALDSPPATDVALGESGGVPSASWTGAGHGFAILGGVSSAQIARLARLVRDSEPWN
jgi:anti-sigma factor RsiW